MNERSTPWLSLLVFILLVAGAAAFGATFKPGDWYAGLTKPSWTPPNWLFAPVWTVLYAMIAVAGWLVWRNGERGAALLAWVTGLAFNAAWSLLFFGRNQIGLALADIIALWCTIALFVVLARRSSATASWLFVPYLLWVSFAAALNAAIWRLNT